MQNANAQVPTYTLRGRGDWGSWL